MDKSRTIIKKICVLAKLNKFGIQKEVNIVKVGEDLFFHFGTWTSDGAKCLDEYMLSEKEMKMLLKVAEKEKLKDSELEKFQKDYAQQSHNGSIDITKEKLL